MTKKILIILLITLVAIAAVVFIAYKQQKEGITKQQLQQKFQNLKTQYEEAKTQGLDVSEVERLGKEAKQAFDKSDYKKASELLDKASAALEKITTPAIPSAPEVKVETICTDGIDNDGDGLIDNEDGDCWIRDGAVFMEDFEPVRTFKELAEMAVELKETGIKTIEMLPIWDHPSGDPEDLLKSHGVRWEIRDYSKLDPERGTEEILSNFIKTAHGFGLKIVPMISITSTFPPSPEFYKDKVFPPGWRVNYDYDEKGGYFYQYQIANPDKEILLKNLKGEFIIMMGNFGISVNQDSQDVIELIKNIYKNYVIDKGFDGIRLDAPGRNNCLEGEKVWFNNKYYTCPDSNVVSEKHSPLPMYRELRKINPPDHVFIAEYWSSEAHFYNYFMDEYPYYYFDNPDIDEVAEASEGYELARLLAHIIITKDLTSSKLVEWIKNQSILYNRQRFRMIRNWNILNPDILKFIATNPAYYPTVTLVSTIPGIPKVSDYELFGNEEWETRLKINVTNTPKERKEHWKKVSNIRNNNNALKYGSIENVWKSGDNIYAYSRTYQNETVVVVINFQGKTATSILNLPFKAGYVLKDELSGDIFNVENPSDFKISVPAYGSRILTIKR